MSDTEYRDDGTDCINAGTCKIHNVEIERRKVDRRDISRLKNVLSALELELDTRLTALHIRINTIANQVSGIFVSLGLVSIIVIGSYYYVGLIDRRNDRGEEILLAKINANAKIARDERASLVAQVVTLLTNDAEQKEWQRGVIRQLEMLNVNMKELSVQTRSKEKNI